MPKRVFDEPNPFGPELKRTRESANKADEQRQIHKFRKRFNVLDAYERHKQLINNYRLYYAGSTATLERDSSKDKGVIDIIQASSLYTPLLLIRLQENHRFLWGAEDLSDAAKNWDKSLAKRYYDKLFKEYCIADLTHFERNKIGLRWRTEAEVTKGKGQFVCGSKHCDVRKKLTTWEVNFSYVEHGEHKNALVKLRLCKECSLKLNFHSQKRRIKKEVKRETAERKHKRHKKKKKRKHRKHRDSSSSSSSSESDGPSTRDQPAEASRSKGDEERRPPTEVDEKTKRKEEAEKAEREARDIWAKPADQPVEEPKPQDEIDEFLDDLFM
ncbi:hypothetical protein M3Y99_00632400 [Aphelenchoides fujianensis]|nr:hypothetical protein M3Y99_00632400 [Aphelenchoides fujianensis]